MTLLSIRTYTKQFVPKSSDNGCVFSPDEINPVQDDISWTRLICSGVKERRNQLRSVRLDATSNGK